MSSNGTIDYGRVGNASYDADLNTWCSRRSCQQSSALHRLGHDRRHIGPSLTVQAETLPQNYASSIRELRQGCSELAGAEDVINSIARDEPLRGKKGVQRTAKGSLLDVTNLIDGEANQTSVVAFASGDRGQTVCVARGRHSREGWQGQYDIALATTHYDESRACYHDDGRGEIQQIALSDQIKNHQLLMAVRYQEHLLVLTVSTVPYDGDSSNAPIAVHLRAFASSDSFSRSMQDLADICFRTNKPFEIFTTHTDGSLCHWRLPQNRHETIRLNNVFSPQHSMNTLAQVSPLTRSVSEQHVAISNTLHLVIRDLGAGTASKYSMLGNGNMLDMKTVQRIDTFLIVLTTTKIIWMQLLTTSSKSSVPLRQLYSWVHHRDQTDLTMRIALLGANTDNRNDATSDMYSSAIIYSQRNTAMTEFEYMVLETDDHLGEPEVLVRDPILMSSPFSLPTDMSAPHLHMHVCLAPLKNHQTELPPDHPDMQSSGQTFAFFQIFWLNYDRSFASCIYYKPARRSRDPNQEPEPLSWSRTLGSRLPLSGRFAHNSFIVDSEDEEDEPQAPGDKPAPWWQMPRLTKLGSRQRINEGRNRNLGRLHDYLKSEFLPEETSLSTLVNSLVHDSLRHSEERSTTSLMSELLNSRIIPHDLSKASESLQRIQSEFTVANNHGLGSLLQEVRLQSHNHKNNGERKLGSTSLRGSFDMVSDLSLALLPEGASEATRVNLEKVARYIVTYSHLSTKMVTPCKQDDYSEGVVNPQNDLFLQQGSILSQKTTDIAEQCRPALEPHSDSYVFQDQKQMTTGLSRVYGTWTGNPSSFPAAPFSIDLSPYDAALITPRSEEEQAESQRQFRKTEKQRRRAEQASQSTMPSSPATGGADHGFTSGQTIPSSQPLSRSGLPASLRNGFGSSQILPSTFQSSQLVTPPLTQDQSVGLSQSQQTAVNDMSLPAVAQNLMKRPKHTMTASQNSVGLPVRKKRKAGF